jgi:L-lactate dehydrogenase complex protein LldF
MSESSACAVPESAAISVTVASGYRIQAGRILLGIEKAPSLPFASSLCGACYEVCPVKIDIPSVLLHLRGRVVREYKSRRSPEALAMETVGRVFASQRRYEQAQKLARLGHGPIVAAALPGWSAMRGLPEVPEQTFREWWRSRPPEQAHGDRPAR